MVVFLIFDPDCDEIFYKFIFSDQFLVRLGYVKERLKMPCIAKKKDAKNGNFFVLF